MANQNQGTPTLSQAPILAVLGAGSWGTGFAMHCARQGVTRLWARNAEQAEAMRLSRQNVRYLPGLSFPAQLFPTDSLEEACSGADGIVIAVPVSAVLSVLTQLGQLSSSTQNIPHLLLCKGFTAPQAIHSGSPPVLVHQEVHRIVPQTPLSILSGPSFAQEVAQGLPTAVTLASFRYAESKQWQQWLHGDLFRTYISRDIIGVAVGGAVKNILAIATGICDGLQLGHNARAALIARGLAEMNRLSRQLGGATETLMGLSGIGDLVLTCTGDLSRNRRVGHALAQGNALGDILAQLGHVAEGVYTAEHVSVLAEHHRLAMPISQAIYAILQGQLTPQKGVLELLAREPQEEIL